MSLSWVQMLGLAGGVVAIVVLWGGAVLAMKRWVIDQPPHPFHDCGCRVRDGFMERCHSHRGTQAMFPVESRRRAP